MVTAVAAVQAGTREAPVAPVTPAAAQVAMTKQQIPGATKMTDKNPLAHYSGVLSEAVQESAAADLPASGAAALSQYLKDCEQHSVVPDVGGAFAFAFAAGFNLATTQAAPIAWPKDAQDVRDFFRSDFITAQFPAQDQAPCDEDRYVISAHDFLSAVNWWADFPHVPREPQAAPTAVAVPAQALTGEARAEAIKRLAPIRAKLATAAPAQAAPAPVAVPDEQLSKIMALADDYANADACAVTATSKEQADTTQERNTLQSALRAALAATPAAVELHCGVCGADEAFTGTCGGGRTNPRALCFEDAAPATTPAAAAPVVLPEPDRIAANLMRFVGLDKDTARKCQEVMRCALLAGVSAPVQMPPVTPGEFSRDIAELTGDSPQAQADARDAESDYQRGYRHGYNRRDAEVKGALL